MDKLKDLLKEALYAEYESAYQYLANSVALEGIHGEIISEELVNEYNDETQHAKLIAKRLEVLDEPIGSFEDIVPEHQMLNPPENMTAEPDDVLNVIEGVIEAEESAIELYREIIEEAKKQNDSTTRRLAEELLADEEQHLDEFKSYREHYV